MADLMKLTYNKSLESQCDIVVKTGKLVSERPSFEFALLPWKLFLPQKLIV